LNWNDVEKTTYGFKLITYGSTHEDDWTSYNTVISDPTVVVTINAGAARFRVKFLDTNPDIIRSSSHEWKGR